MKTLFAALLIATLAGTAHAQVADSYADTREIEELSLGNGNRVVVTNAPCLNGAFFDGQYVAYGDNSLLLIYEVRDSLNLPVVQGCARRVAGDHVILGSNPNPNARAYRWDVSHFRRSK